MCLPYTDVMYDSWCLRLCDLAIKICVLVQVQTPSCWAGLNFTKQSAAHIDALEKDYIVASETKKRLVESINIMKVIALRHEKKGFTAESAVFYYTGHCYIQEG